MAKEAIEQVKLAEERASQILKTAEQEAAYMVESAGKEAQSGLEKAKAAVALSVQNARDDAKKREADLLGAAESDIEQKCAKKRAEMLDKKEMIISRITDAVKK
ncbi:MAG: hypothetical protein UIM24_04000 [Clostridia bacterium]|nr:hypothetical protein [Clostridia bacterium]